MASWRKAESWTDHDMDFNFQVIPEFEQLQNNEGKKNNGTHCDVMQLRQAKEKKCFSCLPDTFGMSGLQGFQKLTFQWLKTSSACIIKGQQYIKSVFQKQITPESKSIFHALDIPFFNLFF